MTAISLAAALLLLGSPDFADREAGSKLLAMAGGRSERASLLAYTLTSRSPNPEIAFRGRELPWLACRHRSLSYALPADIPVWPCLDYCGLGWCNGQKGHVPWLRLARANPGPADVNLGAQDGLWHEYRRATELWARDQIAAGADPADVDAVLRVGWERDVVLLPALASWQPSASGYPWPATHGGMP